MPERTKDLRVRRERLRLLPITDPRHDYLAERQLEACRSLLEAVRKEVS